MTQQTRWKPQTNTSTHKNNLEIIYPKKKYTKQRKKIEELTKACEKDLSEFWKTRKYLLELQNENIYQTIDEEGNVIENEELAKEHIANFYENLYQARPGKPEYEEWTKKIENEVKRIDKELDQQPPPPKITIKELNNAIKALKRNKATGPDGIPNEALIEASANTRKMYLDVINTILKERKPPE